MWNCRSLLAESPDLTRGPGVRDAAPLSPRSGRPEDMDLPRRARRPRARAALDHRSDHGRPAHRERGRAPAHRRQRGALRLRAHPEGARGRGPPAEARGRTARSRCTSTRIWEPRASRSFAESSHCRIWDETNQALFAARDRFGIKPLFYAVHDGDAAPRLGGQGALRGRRPGALEPEARLPGASGGGAPLADALRRRLPGPARALYARDAGYTHLHRYWDFDYARTASLAPDDAADEEYAERLRDVLDEAVRLRLRADVPVGCYLSGGLDSCAVIGLASRHSPNRSAPSR